MKKILNCVQSRHKLFVALIFCLFSLTLVAQNNISLEIKNRPLKEALDAITKATNYKFVYSDMLKEINQPVSFKCENKGLEDVLKQLFAGKKIQYKIEGKVIALSPAELTQAKQSEKLQVFTGVVKDNSGDPLPGVYISVKGSNKSVISDLDGKYSINAPQNAVIIFKFLGMKDQEIPAIGGNLSNVILETDAQRLEEVYVTGYQTLSKERATGSFSVVSQKNLETKLQPSIKSILEGQTSGVVLTKQGDIEIRGVSTILGVKTPLIVVDGYPLIGTGVGIESINPDNIEQVTVLKDAVAASIYGARASNGVIVVTTKKASQGLINLSYKGTYGITMKPDLNRLNISSVEDYMDAELDLYNENTNASFTSYNAYYTLSDYTYLLMAKDKGLITSAEAESRIAALKKNDALAKIQKYILKPKQSFQHNIDLGGGTDKNLLKSSIRFVDERGNLSPNKNTKLIFDINNIWTPKDWISIRVLSNINYSKDHTASENISSLTAFNSSSRVQRYSELYNDKGEMVMYTPVGQRRIEKYQTYPGMLPISYHPKLDNPLMYSEDENLQLRLGGDISLKLADWIDVKVGGSWIRGFNNTQTIQDANSMSMRLNYNDGTSATNPTKHYIPEGGRIDETDRTNGSWVMRGQANIYKEFDGGRHLVSGMVGSEISKDTYYYKYLPTRLGYNPISASYNSGFDPYEYNKNTGNIKGDMLFGVAPTNLLSIGYGGNYGVRDNRFVSWYGNGSYEFKNRYLFSASARLDLTNFFGTDPKYRYKPTWSLGGTYKISEEEYFDGLKNIFNRLYVRASYGVNGNISLNYTPYLVLGVGTHNATMGGISYSISSYPNNTLRWERTQIVNLGVDLSMFKNRLNLTAEFYDKNSNDLIASEAIDETRGVASIPQNVGSLRNYGFEITLDGEIVRREDFSWKSFLVTSYNSSKVTHYNVTRMYFTNFGTANGILVQGYPMDGLWGARFAGLDNTGTALFYNSKGEKIAGGSLGAKDAVYLGTLRPKVDLSFTNHLRYKNTELSMMFIAKLGHKFRKDNFSGSNYINRHVGERWRKPGDEAHTIYPKLTSWNMDMFYYPYSDHLIGSANYLKLRDLSISQTLPKNLTNKIGLSSIKFYFQTRNLFYITAKGVDIDPETAEVNTTGGTGSMTNQAFTSLQLRPEFYFGLLINL